MRLWLRLAWRSRRVQGGDVWESRERLLRSLAPGKTFIDIGGMWNIHGRMAFMAEEAGASRVVLMDAMPATEEFERERERRGSAVEYVKGDLNDRESMAALGTFEVAWCTGVLYHTPHPMLQVEHLTAVASERLVLGTRVIPEVPGLEHACIFYPGQSKAAREEFGRVEGTGLPTVGLTTPFDPSQWYANWWWGMSPSSVRAMLNVAGFAVVEEYSPTPFMSDFVAQPA
jgi:hypothetical protein